MSSNAAVPLWIAGLSASPEALSKSFRSRRWSASAVLALVGGGNTSLEGQARRLQAHRVVVVAHPRFRFVYDRIGRCSAADGLARESSPSSAGARIAVASGCASGGRGAAGSRAWS